MSLQRIKEQISAAFATARTQATIVEKAEVSEVEVIELAPEPKSPFRSAHFQTSRVVYSNRDFYDVGPLRTIAKTDMPALYKECLDSLGHIGL